MDGFESQRKGEISESYERVQLMAGVVESLAGRGEYEAAAACAQVCADFAQRNHPGVFVSPRLERQLRVIAESALPGMGKAASVPREPPAHVLHILTQVHEVGGHSRLAWRWMQNDTDRRYSVALTDQGRIPLPEQMAEAVSRSGGRVHHVDRLAPDLLGRAAALRDLTRPADYAVLHIHPFDVVAFLALADGRDRPKVLLVNHADHLFWIGAEIADAVLVIRDASRKATVGRRSVPEERCCLLPIPLDSPRRRQSRQEAKANLGFEPDSVVCLTMGFPYKFQADDHRLHLGDAVMPVFQSNKTARLIAVGPKAEGHWKSAQRESAGRIRAIGVRSDTQELFEAADIFLMAMPVGSLTSALEAGIWGLPILALRDPSRSDTVLDIDSPGLDRACLRTADIAAYRAQLARLVADETLRTEVGAKTRSVIEELHGKPRWLLQLNEVFARVDGMPPRPRAIAEEPTPQFTPVDLELCTLDRGVLGRPGFIFARRTKTLGRWRRLSLWWRHLRSLTDVSPRYSPIELALLLASRRQAEWLRRRFEHNALFRRLYVK